ncbi:MAG TPA: hypothetical protein VLF63_00930 [Patescibacteria group bacterium]|nr:hypothetical protein [Patescibacteria group bacterium]
MIFQKLKSNHNLKLLIVLSVIDLIFFSKINARQANTTQLTVGILLLLISIFIYSRLLLTVVNRYVFKINKINKASRYLAATFGIFIALKSMGDLNTKDILILIPFIYLAYIYSSYLSKRTQQQD